MWLPGEESSYTERAKGQRSGRSIAGGLEELNEKELWAGWSESQLRTELRGFLKRPCLLLRSKNPLEAFKC